MKLAVPPQIHWISSCALLLNKAFVTVGSYSAHHAQVGRVPNNQTTCSFKALYSTEKKYTKLRNFNASAAIRALPTTTHATLPALIARELEIVGGGLSGDWVTLIAAHNSNTSTIIYKNKASDYFMNQESKLDCISVLIHG